MISLIQTAEGALNETHAILQRMRELAVQASNDTNQDSVDREAINEEISALKEEINRIAKTTQFNEKTLLDGTLGSKIDTDASATDAFVAGVSSITTSGSKVGEYTIAVNTTDNTITITDPDTTTAQTLNITDGAQTLNFSDLGITIKTNEGFVVASTALGGKKITIEAGETLFQIGANEGQTVGLSIGDMSTKGLLIDDIQLNNRENSEAAITKINDAINKVSTQRSDLGALQNRLEHTINNLTNASENLTAAESRIRDVDYALVA